MYFVPGIFVNAFTLEKSPTAAIFVALMALFYMKKNKIGIKFFLIAIGLIFAVPMIIMYFFAITIII